MVVYEIPNIVLENGMDAVQKTIAKYKECRSSGVWPGVDNGEDYVDLRLPQWFLGIGDNEDWEQ